MVTLKAYNFSLLAVRCDPYKNISISKNMQDKTKMVIGLPYAKVAFDSNSQLG